MTAVYSNYISSTLVRVVYSPYMQGFYLVSYLLHLAAVIYKGLFLYNTNKCSLYFIAQGTI
jgi:hypothetical protein